MQMVSQGRFEHHINMWWHLHRKVPENLKKAALFYLFDTENVCTFHLYYNVVEFGCGTTGIPIYDNCDIKPSFLGQPLSLAAVIKVGGILYDMHIWHQNDEVLRNLLSKVLHMGNGWVNQFTSPSASDTVFLLALFWLISSQYIKTRTAHT